MAQADASQKTYRLSDDPSFLTNQEKNHIYRVQHKRHHRISTHYFLRGGGGSGRRAVMGGGGAGRVSSFSSDDGRSVVGLGVLYCTTKYNVGRTSCATRW
jgi:hypothetical protein